jgi:hypothetical protein
MSEIAKDFLEELKEAALRATPGVWVASPNGCVKALVKTGDGYTDRTLLQAVSYLDAPQVVGLANSVFISKANPEAILILIKMVESYRDLLEKYQQQISPH